MDDDEVAHLHPFALALRVVALAQHPIHAPRREQLDQPLEPALHQMDAGRFKRFEKSRGEAERQHIARPRAPAPSGAELEQARGVDWRGVERCHEPLLGLALARITAREDMPVADPALQRNAPLPADRMRSEEHTSELQSIMRISYAVF